MAPIRLGLREFTRLRSYDLAEETELSLAARSGDPSGIPIAGLSTTDLICHEGTQAWQRRLTLGYSLIE